MKLMSRILSTIAIFLISALTAAGQTAVPTAVKTPLPPNLKIQPLDVSLPPDVAAFAGIWIGEWNTNPPRDSTLVVYKIYPKDSKGRHRADFIYSWGPFRARGEAGHIDIEGEINDGELRGQYGRLSLRFKREDDKSLSGTWQTNFGHFQAPFVRVSE
jgi:hypothetical protein